LTPGPAMFGFVIPPNGDGPRLELAAITLLMSNDPTV
jgi:hypothetical protein